MEEKLPSADLTRSACWAMLSAVVLLGAYLRFHNVSDDSLWLDESISWWQSKGSLLEVIRRTAQDTYPPLNNIFIWVSVSLFGDGEGALRLPSAIFGTANIVAIYWLGSMTVGRVAALMAATFLALSGFHVWYSQEARMYALLSLTATMFAASSFYFARSPTILRAALVSIAGLALLYSRPFGALNWIAIGAAISFFVRSSTRIMLTNRNWLAANIVAATLFAPWAWLLHRVAGAIKGRFSNSLPIG